MMAKCKLYVSVTDQRVYHYPDDSPWEYEITVERSVVPIFNRLFKQMTDLEFRNFCGPIYPIFHIIQIEIIMTLICGHKKFMQLFMSSRTNRRNVLLKSYLIFVECKNHLL